MFQLLDEKRNPDVRDIAQVMENAYRAGKDIRNMPQSTCEVSGSERDHRIPRLRVRFTAYSKHADFPDVSDQGVHVSTRERKAVHLSYDCVSTRVGSTQDIPLRIGLLFHDRWDDSKGEAVLRADYLAITHSAALAVAKELQCADDGGLPPHAEALPPPDAP
ncbi:hypothetical protein [Streptomyces sp. NPDC031705]|uniref:hypothetical protein n=1 Tax=Streptomyces sp. NPDC031705 TaxID=3155729 RepID=UPI00340A630E